MSTDNLLLLTQMQQMWPGMASGAASESLTEAGGNPAEFLQTLLQRMQAAAVPATEAIAAAQAVAPNPDPALVPAAGAVPVEKLVERLQALIAQWGNAPALAEDLPAAAETGKGEAAGGKTLPVGTLAPSGKTATVAGETDAPAGLPLASGAEQWLQELIQRVMPQSQAAEIPRDANAGPERMAEPAAEPVAANRAVAELVHMLRAAGLPVDDALAAQPDSAKAAVMTETVPVPAAHEARKAVEAKPPEGKATAVKLERATADPADSFPTHPFAPMTSEADSKPATDTPGRAEGVASMVQQVRGEGGAFAVPQARGEGAAFAVPQARGEGAGFAVPQERGEGAAFAPPQTPDETGRLAGFAAYERVAQPVAAAPLRVSQSARAGSDAEPASVAILQTGQQPSAEPVSKVAPVPRAEAAPVTVSDPVIAQLLRNPSKTVAEAGQPAGSEPAPESVAAAGSVPLAAVAARSGAPRQPKPVSGDAKSLSGLERLAKRASADADPLVAQLAEVPAAARDEVAIRATEEPLNLPAATAPTGLTGEAVVAAEAKPVALAQDKLQAEIQAPLQHSKWPQELGQRVNWLAGLKEGIQTAEIKLNPAHLGPLEVRVNLNQDQASIQFVSHHAAVREAIESAVPKLREMLGEQNLTLVDVNVSQQSFSGDQRQPATAQFDFGRNSQGGGTAASSDGFAQGGEAEVTGETLQRQNRTDGGSLSLYA